MKLGLYISLSIIFLLASCKQTTPVAETIEGAFFGEEFSITNTTSVPTAISSLGQKDTLDIQLSGVVESVCKKKGCWTNIASKDNLEETMFVKFKDYGFFLPLDCEGQEVVLQGQAYMEETPVDELRHYAEDEGKSAEEIALITEPTQEYKFMASGAFLKNKL